MLLMDETIIYIIPTSLIKDHYAFVFSCADEKRKMKVNKYVNEKDKLLSLGVGYLMYKYLPKGEVLVTKSGKPYLANGPFFNISHSGEYAVLAVHPSRDVGVDIERIDEKKLDSIKFVLGDEEKDIKDINTLFQIWSNKESLIKCMSTGLKDIRNVKGLPLEGLRTVDGSEYFNISTCYDGYSLAISLKGKEPFNINMKRIEVLEEE